jgi:hypothetical protein
MRVYKRTTPMVIKFTYRAGKPTINFEVIALLSGIGPAGSTQQGLGCCCCPECC